MGFRIVMVAAVHALAVSACTAAPETSTSTSTSAVARPVRAVPLPERPAACRDVATGERVEDVIAASTASAFCLADGVHLGPVQLRRAVTLWGGPRAVLRSTGSGTTVTVSAAGAQVLGLTVDGSGQRYDTDDAAVRVQGDDVVIEGVTVVNATFGILVERAERVTLRGNRISGHAGSPAGLRGDAIRLWETRHSRVERNLVQDSRDVVVWYSSSNRFAHNVIERGRYGTHFMYSHDNLVEENDFLGNVVGVFVMYSRGLRLHGNRIRDGRGAAGMGIGLKDSGNVEITRNELTRVTTALYLDTSPLDRSDRDVIADNRIALAASAIVFHGPARGNRFERNVLAGNGAQVVVEGGGDAREAEFAGNAYDDYAGYDLDGDGTGDVPHEERSLAADVTSQRPDVAFFSGSPALGIVEAAGKLVPLFAPKTLMRDPSPRAQLPKGAGDAS